jgi:hypothetical protein
MLALPLLSTLFYSFFRLLGFLRYGTPMQSFRSRADRCQRKGLALCVVFMYQDFREFTVDFVGYHTPLVTVMGVLYWTRRLEYDFIPFSFTKE